MKKYAVNAAKLRHDSIVSMMFLRIIFLNGWLWEMIHANADSVRPSAMKMNVTSWQL